MLWFLIFITLWCDLTLSTEVCYPPYGCFTSDYPFNFALVQLPEAPKYVGTTFSYYTRNNSLNPDWLNPLTEKSPSQVGFNASKPTVMFTHGYLESRYQWYVQMFIDELLKYDDMNIILCEWANGAAFPYHQAAGNSRLVGRQMARMIEVIRNDTGINWSKLHLVGFSLGAHVVAHAGKVLKDKGLNLPRITGLDPAAPYFEYEHKDVRIDETDADFVDVVHTDTKTLLVNGFGSPQQMGHVDFFPNGGYHQLGCGKLDIGVVQYFACSHYRAIRYFMESINSKCTFHGYPCPNYKDFTDLKCSKCPQNGCPVMGFHSKKPQNKMENKLYFQTHREFPYCGNHYKITFHTGTIYFADLSGSVKIELIGNKTSEIIELPSRYYASGSVESHLVLVRKDLGDLLKVKIKHGATLDIWYLLGVTVEPMWQNTRLTACYNRWINNDKNEVALDDGKDITHCTNR